MAIRIDYTPITGLMNLAAAAGQQQQAGSRQQQAAQIYQNEILRRQQAAQEQQMVGQQQHAAQELQLRQMMAGQQQQQFQQQHQLAQQALAQQADEARMRDMATQLQRAAQTRMKGSPTGSAFTRVQPEIGTYTDPRTGMTQTHQNQRQTDPAVQSKLGIVESMKDLVPAGAYEALKQAAMSPDMDVPTLTNHARQMMERQGADLSALRFQETQTQNARREFNSANAELQRIEQTIAKMETNYETDTPAYQTLVAQKAAAEQRKLQAQQHLDPMLKGTVAPQSSNPVDDALADVMRAFGR